MENKRLINLLDRFFANICTAEEKATLMQLLNSNQCDDALKGYIDDAWGKIDPAPQLTDRQSENILSAILSRNKTPVIPHTTSYKNWFRAAAAAILISLSMTAYFLFTGSKQNKQSIAANKQVAAPVKNDVAPGSTGAVLTLSDGSVIVLDSATDGSLATQGNTKILKTGGAVQYVAGTVTTEQVSSYNTVGTPRGRKFQLVLEDGTKVWLNAESSIRFPTVFSKSERQVTITGEVYFEVAKNVERPFTVSVNGMQVQVLGTHFNINAYNDEPAIKTTLLEGSVKVIKNDHSKMLAPGQQASLNYTNNQVRLIKNVNTKEIVAWKNDQFSFNNTSLENLMRQLSRWYDVEIVQPATREPLTFTGNISRKSNLSDVLKMLELTGEVRFLIEGKKVTVNM